LNEERRLVEEAQRGSQEAFEAIVRRHERKVFQLAYGFVRDRAAADDLAQEIFLKVYVSLAKFHGRSEFGTWLYRIAINHIKDFLRKAGRKKEVSLQEFEDSLFPVAEIPEGRERAELEELRRRALYRVLETLPAKYRMILTLRDIEGLSYSEVARALKTSLGTVDSRLHRARKILRERMARFLEREGGGHEMSES
jgi:RNA polymerase sigma-70 factor (ECF subfamily)